MIQQERPRNKSDGFDPPPITRLAPVGSWLPGRCPWHGRCILRARHRKGLNLRTRHARLRSPRGPVPSSRRSWLRWGQEPWLGAFSSGVGVARSPRCSTRTPVCGAATLPRSPEQDGVSFALDPATFAERLREDSSGRTRAGQNGPETSCSPGACSAHHAFGAAGFTTSMSGKRMKSRSVVAIDAPCSIASAARCASITMGPLAWPS